MFTALYPPAATSSENSRDVLNRAYAYPTDLAQPYVRALMISSLDGSATGPSGISGELGTAADKAVYAHLRGLSDAIIVAAGTARAENYGPVTLPESVTARRVAAGQAPQPTLIVVTRTAEFPPDSPLLAAAGGPVVIAYDPELAPARHLAALDKSSVELLPCPQLATVGLPAVTQWCSTHGLHRLLHEGGPSFLGEGLAAGLIDELCLTVSAVTVAGPGPRIAHGVPATTHWELASLLYADDSTLLTRYTRRKEHL